MNSAAHLISSLSWVGWVLLIIAVVVILRKPLSALLGKVSEVDLPYNVKVLLNQQTGTAAAITKRAVTTNRLVTNPAPADPAVMAKEATADPGQAVRSSWLAVEQAIEPAMKQYGHDAPVASLSVPKIVHDMAAQGLVDPAVETAATDLARLRDLAGGTQPVFTAESALNFSAGAHDLATLLRAVGPHVQASPPRAS